MCGEFFTRAPTWINCDAFASKMLFMWMNFGESQWITCREISRRVRFKKQPSRPAAKTLAGIVQPNFEPSGTICEIAPQMGPKIDIDQSGNWESSRPKSARRYQNTGPPRLSIDAIPMPSNFDQAVGSSRNQR